MAVSVTHAFVTSIPDHVSANPHIVRPSHWNQDHVANYTATGTAAAERGLSDKLDEWISPADFGAAGDGVADDTASLQACFNAAASRKVGIVDRDETKIYLVGDTIRVKAGTPAVIMRSTIKGDGTTLNGILHLDGATVYSATQLDGCRVSVVIDMSGGDAFGLYCDGNDNCVIEGCRIYGPTNHATANRRAIYLPNGASFNIIANNDIELFSTPTARHFGVDMSGDGQADFGGFFDDPPTVTATSDPCIGNVVIGNNIRGGSYAVNMLGCEDCVIVGNYCRDQNHRSIYMANVSQHNLIEGNRFEDYTSSAVLMGYNSRYNSIVGNKCRTSALAGEAAININTGASYNAIIGNTIDGPSHYGVYLAVNVAGNSVIGNDIRNHYVGAIVLEANWEDSPPASAVYARPNYEAPTTIDAGFRASWAHADSEDNVIKGNVIHHGYTGRSTGAIAVYSYDGPDTVCGVSGTVIDGNVVATTDQITHDLHIYEETSGKVTGLRLRNNDFPIGSTRAVITASAAALVQVANNTNVFQATATVNPTSLATGASTTTATITVTGAALGDLVRASFSLSLAGVALTAWVSAADTVSYFFTNHNGTNPLDLGSGTLKVRVEK